MGGKNYTKGRYAEYYLAKILMRYGYAVLRAPASGAKAKRFPYPDIIAFLKGRLLVFEVKRRQRRQTVYLSEEQYRTLKYWADRGAEAYVAVRYDTEGPDFFIVPLSCVEHSDGKYRLPVEKVIDCSKKIQEVV